MRKNSTKREKRSRVTYERLEGCIRIQAFEEEEKKKRGLPLTWDINDVKYRILV